MKSFNYQKTSNLATIEKDFHNLFQYNRQECIEVVAESRNPVIPETVLDVNLENNGLKIFSTIDVKVEKHQIHAWHRLPKKTGSVLAKRTIIRFVNRKKHVNLSNATKSF